MAGVSDVTWARWEKGESDPGIEAVEKFSSATGENLFFLLTGEKPIEIKDQREIPIIDQIPAGPLTQGFGELSRMGSVRSDIKDPDAFALLVKVSSMVPEIQEGDVIVCSPRAEFANGRIYATVVGDGEQSLKRVRYDRASLSYVLIPSNKEFPTLYIPENQIVKLIRVAQVHRDLL